MNDIIKVLMERDELSQQEATKQFNDAQDEFQERLGNGENVYDFCSEYFGLEPDYLMDLLDTIQIKI